MMSTIQRPNEGTASGLAATPSTYLELMAAARRLAPIIQARAAQTERDRRLSDEVSGMLNEAGLFRALQPKRFGGHELAIEELRQLAFEIGRGCANTGWCYGLGSGNSWITGMFPGEAQDDVWSRDPRALIAGCIAPTGKVRKVDSGYQLHGRWSFASNCDNSQWLTLGAMLELDEGKPPQALFVLVPKADCLVIDTWYTMGLAGTGSKDIAIESEVFVPAHRTVTFFEVLNQEAPGALANDGALYRIPFLSGFSALLANPAIAALQGAVDEFIESVAMRPTRGAFTGGGGTIGQFGHVQTAVAEAEAAVDAAQLVLERDLSLATRLAASGVKLTVDQRVTIRRGAAYAVRLCVNGVNGLFEAVGGTGINLNSGIQRAWRDINAVAHHISLNWAPVSTMYGQMRFGMPPKGQY